MLKGDLSGHHCCTNEVLQSTLTTYFAFTVSRKRWWGLCWKWPMLKKEPAACNRKVPSYDSLDTQSICPSLPVLCTGPPMNTGLFTWYQFVLWRLCNTQKLKNTNTGPGWHKLTLADKNIHCSQHILDVSVILYLRDSLAFIRHPCITTSGHPRKALHLMIIPWDTLWFRKM